jgi:hypothetical protein
MCMKQQHLANRHKSSLCSESHILLLVRLSCNSIKAKHRAVEPAQAHNTLTAYFFMNFSIKKISPV